VQQVVMLGSGELDDPVADGAGSLQHHGARRLPKEPHLGLGFFGRDAALAELGEVLVGEHG
jgi:hypothetical protein